MQLHGFMCHLKSLEFFFPSEPSVGSNKQGLMHFPYFSLWIYGLLISIFGHSVSLFLIQIIFPIIIFILMVNIYKIYLPFLWAISLTSLGLISYSYINFRDFLLNIFSGEGWQDFLTGEQFGISSTPFPSISLLFFLLAFLITFKRKRLLTSKRIFIFKFSLVYASLFSYCKCFHWYPSMVFSVNYMVIQRSS